jgi:hypothetical protein
LLQTFYSVGVLPLQTQPYSTIESYLVPAVLEHDDVQDGREHLLEDLGTKLDDLNECVVVGNHLAAPNLA